MWKCCFLSVISTSVAVGNSDLLFLLFVQFFLSSFFLLSSLLHFSVPPTISPLLFALVFFLHYSLFTPFVLLHCVLLCPVGDSAHQPPPHFDPFHHVRVIWGHASSGEPPQRHRLQLRPRADQGHGTTHKHTLTVPQSSCTCRIKRLPGTAYPIRGSFYFVLCGKQKLLMLTEVIFLLLMSRSKQVLGWIWLAWRW